MAFSKSRILSAKNLSRLVKESTENSEQRFCFILGSGASVESGIPSGSSLEMQWMDCLMGKSLKKWLCRGGIGPKPAE